MPSNIENYVFVGKMGFANLKIVIQLLKAINFKEIAIVGLGKENGLKITVEDAKCMQGAAYIPSSVFDEYDLKEDVIFSLSLSILVDCLCMLRSHEDSATLQIFYQGTGYPLSIIIEEDSVITDCSLRTLEVETMLDFHFKPEDVVNKVVLQTELLKDVMGELDSTSEVVELCLSPEKPYFRISTEGLGGVCHIDLPHNSDLIGTFQCTLTATSIFKLMHIKPAMKALSCSKKVSLRTNKAGLLCFQYLIETENGQTCYIEYYISPLLEIED
ncbi:hypothetical protein PUN28_001526 [Cardiocondyla obscurior]|uniref:Cell cycle checkpoint protein RAD1 n=1 Tax=Cardiocondyla obscurior TaxID=286306 RepID=A0AAW2H5H5_9HYME